MVQIPRRDVANKPLVPAALNEVVKTTSKIALPPFGHKVIHGITSLALQGCKMNVMTHGLERRSPLLPLGVEVLSVYATLATGSKRVAVALRNTTKDWLEVRKGTPVVRMEAANQIPPVTGPVVSPEEEQPTLSESERQALLMDKLDSSGLESWPPEVASQAGDLLREYHDIFSVEKNEIGHTKATEHKIVLKDPESAPFKERFRRIPPPKWRKLGNTLK